MLAGRNGARGRIRTCTGDPLDVVSLLVGLREQNEMEPPAGDDSGRNSLQKKSAGCCMEARWSQYPVPPWAQQAYETCLSAGSTATAAKSNGALTRNCTELNLQYQWSASLKML